MLPWVPKAGTLHVRRDLLEPEPVKPPRKLGYGLEETLPVAGNPPWASTMLK